MCFFLMFFMENVPHLVSSPVVLSQLPLLLRHLLPYERGELGRFAIGGRGGGRRGHVALRELGCWREKDTNLFVRIITSEFHVIVCSGNRSRVRAFIFFI